MASAARGPNSLGSQVIPGLVGPSLELCNQTSLWSGQAGSFGDDARAAASQGFSLTGGPLTAQSLSHQRMELVIFGPHGFHSQGLIHTIIRVQDPCQTTAQTFKLFFDSSEGTIATVPPAGGYKQSGSTRVPFDTTNVLFICGGAFVGLEDIIAKRLGRGGFGFGQMSENRQVAADGLLR